MREFGLYVHIPFCEAKCNYCSFTSFPNHRDYIQPYIDSLIKEIKYYPHHSISSIYIGGGTPSLLSEDQVIRLSEAIRKNFTVNNDCEFSIEANPGTVNIDKLKAFKNAGINRLSIGAQSFDDSELALLGRIHNSKQIVEAYAQALKAGFTNINLDIIFAIPGQTTANWTNTLKETINLKPAHISAYNLQIEEGTPFFDKKIGTYVKTLCNASLSDDDIEFEQYSAVIDSLKNAGYGHYEISNFALPGYECRHNITYWKNGDYLGVGIAAASHFNNKRFENTKNLKEYIENPVNNSVEDGDSKTNEITDTIFMGLRLLDGLNMRDFKDRFNADITSLYNKEINELNDLGLIEINSSHLKLSPKGLFLANEVFERFV